MEVRDKLLRRGESVGFLVIAIGILVASGSLPTLSRLLPGLGGL